MVWCESENNLYLSTALTALVTSNILSSISTYTLNAIIINTSRIWQQFRTHMGLMHLSVQAPVCHT